ncbi:MAG: hypothetical protein ABI134_36435, partial [Byssovorax sp.]
MDPHNADADIFVDWLLHAYVGTRELHDVTPRPPGAEDPFARQYLVAVNDGVQAPRLLKREEDLRYHLWVVPPAVWEQAREGHVVLPDGFGREPVR